VAVACRGSDQLSHLDSMDVGRIERFFSPCRAYTLAFLTRPSPSRRRCH